VVPVHDLEARARIDVIVATLMADDVNSWQLGSDAVWRPTEEIQGQPGTVDTFAVMKEAAHQAAATTLLLYRSAAIAGGSLDPRA
jgi:hypothetical protein